MIEQNTSPADQATAVPIERLMLSIAVNQFTVPLPTGKEIVTAVNAYQPLRKALTAAVHALRSYQYGNSETQLAEEVADAGDAALSLTGEGAGSLSRTPD